MIKVTYLLFFVLDSIEIRLNKLFRGSFENLAFYTRLFRIFRIFVKLFKIELIFLFHFYDLIFIY